VNVSNNAQRALQPKRLSFPTNAHAEKVIENEK
jgi:hypothetical protein